MNAELVEWRPVGTERPLLGPNGLLRLGWCSRSTIAHATVVQVDRAVLERVTEGRRARQLARDVEAMHLITQAVLGEHSVFLPTVLVVVGVDGSLQRAVERWLTQPSSASATWFMPSAGTEDVDLALASEVVSELLSPKIGKAQAEAPDEGRLQQDLRGWFDDDGLAVLRPLWSAVGSYELFGAGARGDGTVDDSLADWRQRAEEAFAEQLRLCVTNPSPSPDPIGDLGEEARSEVLGAPRLKSIRMRNIGGVAERTVEFGRHVTVLYGANGSGKSSLARALALSLNDHHDGVATLLKAGEREASIDWTFRADAEAGMTSTLATRITLRAPAREKVPELFVDDGPWRPRRSPLAPELRNRLTVLADEDVMRVLQEGEAPFLRAVLPRPPRREALVKVLSDANAVDGLLDRELKRTNDAEASAKELATREGRERFLREGYIQEVTAPLLLHRSNPVLREVDDALSMVERHGGFDSVERSRRALLRAARSQAVSAGQGGSTLAQRLGDVESALAELGGDGEADREALKWLGAHGRGASSDLDDLLSGLISGVERWGEAPPRVAPRVVRPVIELFGAVNVAALRELRDSVIGQVASLRGRERKREALEQEKRSLGDQLRTAELMKAVQDAAAAAERWVRENADEWTRLDAELAEARRAHGEATVRQAVRDRIAAIREAIEVVLAQGQSDRTVATMADEVQGELNRLVVRYNTLRVGAGSEKAASSEVVAPDGDGTNAQARELDGPVRVTLGGTFGDRLLLEVAVPRSASAQPGVRGIRTLSTGQKFQVGLAWMIAQRRLVHGSEAREWMGHRCLVLDDAGSGQDEDALAREAVVLRQLAYAADERDQLQLIIFTHHRKVADRYRQLLAPPPGCEMTYVHMLAADEAPEVSYIPSWQDPPDLRWGHLHQSLIDTLTFGRPPESP